MYTDERDKSGQLTGVCLLGSFISANPDNTDFQAFLSWYATQERPPFSLDPIPLSRLKTRDEFTADFAGYLTREQRMPLWAALVRWSLPNALAIAQFDALANGDESQQAELAAQLNNVALNSVLSERLLDKVQAEPASLVAMLASINVTYDAYVTE